MTRRLHGDSNEVKDILENSKVLSPSNWPESDNDNIDIRYGEKQIIKLCKRFKISERESIEGMREYIDNKATKVPENP